MEPLFSRSYRNILSCSIDINTQWKGVRGSHRERHWWTGEPCSNNVQRLVNSLLSLTRCLNGLWRRRNVVGFNYLCMEAKKYLPIKANSRVAYEKNRLIWMLQILKPDWLGLCRQNISPNPERTVRTFFTAFSPRQTQTLYLPQTNFHNPAGYTIQITLTQIQTAYTVG